MTTRILQKTYFNAFIFSMILILPSFKAISADYTLQFNSLLKNHNLQQSLDILQDTIDKTYDNQKALYAAQLYMKLASGAQNKQHIAVANRNLGVAYWQISNHDKAFEYLFHSLQMSSELKDTAGKINTQIYIGLVYSREENWKMVGKYYQIAYDLANSFRNNFLIASSSWNMAYYNCCIYKKEESLKFAHNALVHLEMLDQNAYLTKFGYGLTYFYTGHAYSQAGMYDSSALYYQKAIEWNKMINNLNILAPALSNKSISLNKLGQNDSAIAYGLEAVRVSQAINNFFYMTEAYEQIALAYEKKNDFLKSLEFYKLFKYSTDSLNKYDARAVSAKLELQSAEKQFRQEKEYQQAKDTYIYIISALTLLTLCVVSFTLYSKYRVKNKLSSELKESNFTKDKFFEIIAHDLMSPLAGLYSLTTTICRYYEHLGEDEKLTYLNNLKNSTDSIMNLTENLLHWARLQSNKFSVQAEKIEIRSVVEKKLSNLINSAQKKNITIENSICKDTLLFADIDMTGAIVRNLISNSIKFTNENGKIVIDGIPKGKEFVVSVADNGVGIKQEYFGKIFDVSSKLSTFGTSNEKGTGLGLSLCKEFIEKNNGKIWFESERGKGSKFFFSLPIYHQI